MLSALQRNGHQPRPIQENRRHPVKSAVTSAASVAAAAVFPIFWTRIRCSQIIGEPWLETEAKHSQAVIRDFERNTINCKRTRNVESEDIKTVGNGHRSGIRRGLWHWLFQGCADEGYLIVSYCVIHQHCEFFNARYGQSQQTV
jgi:hypothetical protein